MTTRIPIHISGSYPPMTCGIGDYTYQLSRHLASLGVPVEVWTKRTETPVPGVRGCVERWDRDGFRTLARLLQQHRPSLVHLQYEPGIYGSHPAITLLPLLTRRMGIPLVTTFHSLDGPRLWGRARRAALAPLLLGSQDLIVCSQRQWHAVKRFQSRGRTVSLIPVGSSIDVAAVRETGDEPSSDRDASFRLLYFGFVWQGRNIETLLRALASVIEVRPGATLEVVGGIRDESYLREVSELAARLGVAGRVTFSGDRSSEEISHAMMRADVALLPFTTGVSTGRTTLMAALAHRLPVVTYGVGENLSPLFRHRENMMIAPQGDEEEFSAQVRELASDVDLRERLAAGAEELADAFSWSRIAAQISDLPSYRNLQRSSGVRSSLVGVGGG